MTQESTNERDTRYDDPVEMDVPLGEYLEVSAMRAHALVQETGRTVHFMFIYNAWAFPGDTVRDIILRRNPYYYIGKGKQRMTIHQQAYAEGTKAAIELYLAGTPRSIPRSVQLSREFARKHNTQDARVMAAFCFGYTNFYDDINDVAEQFGDTPTGEEQPAQ